MLKWIIDNRKDSIPIIISIGSLLVAFWALRRSREKPKLILKKEGNDFYIENIGNASLRGALMKIIDIGFNASACSRIGYALSSDNEESRIAKNIENHIIKLIEAKQKNQTLSLCSINPGQSESFNKYILHWSEPETESIKDMVGLDGCMNEGAQQATFEEMEHEAYYDYMSTHGAKTSNSDEFLPSGYILPGEDPNRIKETQNERIGSSIAQLEIKIYKTIRGISYPVSKIYRKKAL